MRPDEPLMTPECLLLPCAQAQGDLISSSAHHGVRGSRQASERAAEDASGRSVGLIRSKRFLGSLVLFAHKDISHDSQYKFYTLNFEEFQHFRPGIAKERL